MIFKIFDTEKINTARSDKERRGFINEKETAYLIDFELKTSEDYAVLHDLRFEYNGRTAQIDHLIIGRNFIFVVESKFFGGNLEIGDDTWIVNYGSKKYSISSPIRQNKRHIQVLQEMIDREDIFPKNKIIPTLMNIVLISNKTIIKGSRPKEIVYADSFRDKMKSSIAGWILKNPLALFSMKSNFPVEDFPKICEKLLKFHKPIKWLSDKQTTINEEQTVHEEPDMGTVEKEMPAAEDKIFDLTNDEVLYNALKKTRRHLAHENGVMMVHHVFNDDTLQEFVTKRPHDKTGMLAIRGVGEVKFERYGKQFLEIINPEQIHAPVPSPLPSQSAAEEKPESLVCERCGSPMLHRKGKPGQTDFYGCSAYPKCRHTIKIKSAGE